MRPDRVSSVGWWTQKQDAPGKQFTPNKEENHEQAFYADELLLFSYIYVCALFKIDERGRRDHRGDRQPRKTQRNQQSTLEKFSSVRIKLQVILFS